MTIEWQGYVVLQFGSQLRGLLGHRGYGSDAIVTLADGRRPPTFEEQEDSCDRHASPLILANSLQSHIDSIDFAAERQLDSKQRNLSSQGLLVKGQLEARSRHLKTMS